MDCDGKGLDDMSWMLVTRLVDDNLGAGNPLLSQRSDEPRRFIDAQHGGNGGDDKLCLTLIPEQVPHHDHAVLQATHLHLSRKAWQPT